MIQTVVCVWVCVDKGRKEGRRKEWVDVAPRLQEESVLGLPSSLTHTHIPILSLTHTSTTASFTLSLPDKCKTRTCMCLHTLSGIEQIPPTAVRCCVCSHAHRHTNGKLLVCAQTPNQGCRRALVCRATEKDLIWCKDESRGADWRVEVSPCTHVCIYQNDFKLSLSDTGSNSDHFQWKLCKLACFWLSNSKRSCSRVEI